MLLNVAAMIGESCYYCDAGHFERSTTTFTVERGDQLVVVRDVPAAVCDACGEAVIDDEVYGVLQREVEAALQGGGEVIIRHFEPVEKAA